MTERLKEIERLINNYLKEKEPAARRKWLIQIQRRLVKSQEYGDDKLQLVGNMIDLVSRSFVTVVSNQASNLRSSASYVITCRRLLWS